MSATTTVRAKDVFDKYADYGVAELRLSDGLMKRREHEEGLPLNIAQRIAEKWNEEEVTLARMECRQVNREFVIIRQKHSFDLVDVEKVEAI